MTKKTHIGSHAHIPHRFTHTHIHTYTDSQIHTYTHTQITHTHVNQPTPYHTNIHAVHHEKSSHHKKCLYEASMHVIFNAVLDTFNNNIKVYV